MQVDLFLLLINLHLFKKSGRLEKLTQGNYTPIYFKNKPVCKIILTLVNFMLLYTLMLKLNHIFTGLAASLGLTLIFYWGLRLDSSLASLINNTKSQPIYLWSYLILTAATIFLFGWTFALLAYQWEKFGQLKLKQQSGTGLSALAGLLASACPVCGSTLLSAIGLAGGLTAFPLDGLELKILSLGFVLLSFVLIKKSIKKNECAECAVTPQESKPNEKKLLVPISFAILFFIIGWQFFSTDPLVAKYFPQTKTHAHASSLNSFSDKLADDVLPSTGWQSKISLGDSVLKLIEVGVIDKQKFEKLYETRGGLPPELKKLLENPSPEKILLTRENASYYLNLLWPLGLANHMEINNKSPIKGGDLFNFASTGGWTLGKAENGGEYFNKFKIIPLSPEQEELVLAVADNSYRPCCGNSAFFQDCNHGSALLGLIELGAVQGLNEEELFREALAFNSFWFPEQYLSTAIYFKKVKGLDWQEVDPKIIMGKDFSSARGWSQNVYAKLQELNLVPEPQGGGGCGV